MKKALLIHPTQERVGFSTPHLGLALLAAALKKAGHQVEVLDYILDGREEPLPPLEHEVQGFQPDLIGISLSTATVTRAMSMLRRAKGTLDVPVVAGGPHATLNADRLIADPLVDTVVAGEGEDLIADIAEDPLKYRGRIVRGGPVDVNEVALADFSAFVNAERMRVYPLMTSRGCPFACSFCCVHLISSRRWRPRDLEACFKELDLARERLPNIEQVQVHDDCPTADPGRFKEFLRRFIQKRYALPLEVANLRANSVDAELVRLLREAGSDAICIAAEHGNPEVFRLINKGETLEDVERAARIITNEGMKLRLCFVIGLPGDSLERTKDSIRLAKRLKPSFIYWNMAHPFPGTAIREWYEAHGGALYPDDDQASYRRPTLDSEEPLVETPDFTRAERKKAKFLAAIETDHYNLREFGVLGVWRRAAGYSYRWKAIRSLVRKWWHRRTRRPGRRRRPMKWNEFYPEAVELAEPNSYISELATHREFLAAILQAKPRTLLEVGAGTGRMSVFLSHLGFRVTAIDKDSSLVERARRVCDLLHGTVDFQCADAFGLPFADDSFDLVFHQGVLEHFDDEPIRALLTEQLRVAGTVVFSVPSHYYTGQGLGNERRMSREQWEQVLTGYNVVESRYYHKARVRGRFGFSRRRPLMYMAKVCRP